MQIIPGLEGDYLDDSSKEEEHLGEILVSCSYPEGLRVGFLLSKWREGAGELGIQGCWLLAGRSISEETKKVSGSDSHAVTLFHRAGGESNNCV